MQENALVRFSGFSPSAAEARFAIEVVKKTQNWVNKKRRKEEMQGKPCGDEECQLLTRFISILGERNRSYRLD